MNYDLLLRLRRGLPLLRFWLFFNVGVLIANPSGLMCFVSLCQHLFGMLNRKLVNNIVSPINKKEMTMQEDLEKQINYLKQENETLKKQKQILFDFFTLLPDHLTHAIKLIGAGKIQEAIDKLTNLQSPVFHMLKEVISSQKLP